MAVAAEFGFVLGRLPMGIAFHHKHLYAGAHHSFWLILAAVVAFLMAALWATPIG